MATMKRALSDVLVLALRTPADTANAVPSAFWSPPINVAAIKWLNCPETFHDGISSATAMPVVTATA